MNTSLPHSRPLFLGLAAVAILGCEGVIAQAVIPGEFTDPTNLRRLAQDTSDYKTPEHLKFPYISTYYVKPTDGETGAITLRDCAFGAGVANEEIEKRRAFFERLGYEVDSDGHVAGIRLRELLSSNTIPAVCISNATLSEAVALVSNEWAKTSYPRVKFILDATPVDNDEDSDENRLITVIATNASYRLILEIICGESLTNLEIDDTRGTVTIKGLNGIDCESRFLFPFGDSNLVIRADTFDEAFEKFLMASNRLSSTGSAVNTD